MDSSVLLSLVLTFSFGLEAVNCFMFRSISSHAFKGLISQTLFDLDWLSCLEACSRSETCVSYNYNSLTDTEGRGSVCELISGGKYLGECDTSHLVYQTGYVFHRIKLSSKEANGIVPYETAVQDKGFTDCHELLQAGRTQSGVYTINPDGKNEFEVFCDQKTNGGGWVVFQKRFLGLVDFFRDWASYRVGFGNLTGEFWLGLDKIHRLTSLKRTILLVNLGDFNGASAHAMYDRFQVSSEENLFELHDLGKYSGTAGDSLKWHNGLPYSTKDHNTGDCPDEECAKMYHGAWWYGDSIRSNLNGKYYMTPIAPAHDGIIWAGWRGFNTSLKWTEMKMRPCLD